MPPAERVVVDTKAEPVPAAPEPPAPPPAPPRGGDTALEGTKWSGMDSMNHHYTFEFRPGGALRYTSPSGTYNNGRWKQNGAQVEMDMNDHYSDYTGAIAGDEITGDARNKRGREWKWSVKKQ